MQRVREPVDGDGVEARVGEDHLVHAARGGVALEEGPGVVQERIVNGGEPSHEPLDLAGHVGHGPEARGHHIEERSQPRAYALDRGGEGGFVTARRDGVMGEQHPEHVEREGPSRPSDPGGTWHAACSCARRVTNWGTVRRSCRKIMAPFYTSRCFATFREEFP